MRTDAHVTSLTSYYPRPLRPSALSPYSTGQLKWPGNHSFTLKTILSSTHHATGRSLHQTSEAEWAAGFGYTCALCKSFDGVSFGNTVLKFSSQWQCMRYANSEDFTTFKRQLSFTSQLSGRRQLERWSSFIVFLSFATQTLLRCARGTWDVYGRLAGCQCQKTHTGCCAMRMSYRRFRDARRDMQRLQQLKKKR